MKFAVIIKKKVRNFGDRKYVDLRMELIHSLRHLEIISFWKIGFFNCSSYYQGTPKAPLSLPICLSTERERERDQSARVA